MYNNLSSLQARNLLASRQAPERVVRMIPTRSTRVTNKQLLNMRALRFSTLNKKRKRNNTGLTRLATTSYPRVNR